MHVAGMLTDHAAMISHPLTASVYCFLFWPTGDFNILASVALKARTWHHRQNYLHINLDTGTNSKRADVVADLSQIPGALAVTSRIGWQEYLRQMADSKFVAAPPGNGLDTHRAWEVREA